MSFDSGSSVTNFELTSNLQQGQQTLHPDLHPAHLRGTFFYKIKFRKNTSKMMKPTKSFTKGKSEKWLRKKRR